MSLSYLSSPAAHGAPAQGYWIEPFPWREPAEAFAAVAEQNGSIFMDSALSGDPRACWSIIAIAPNRVLTGHAEGLRVDGQQVAAPLSDVLRALCPKGEKRPQGDAPSDLPLPGLFGYLSYEAGRHFERMPVHKPDGRGFPEVFAGVYEAIAAFHMADRKAWLVGIGPAGREKAEHLGRVLGRGRSAPPMMLRPGEWLEDSHAIAFPDMVRKTIDYINAGDIFQANISWRFNGFKPERTNTYDLYSQLRRILPAPFAAFLRVDEERAILSASPERFLKVEPDGWVETRPIKGTFKRSDDPGEDLLLARHLATSLKNQAENLMIVDLMRNDLSRNCVIGSVHTPKLFSIESYPGIHHMVSVVRGQLKPGLDIFHLLGGAFPPGSITGAPKVRCMEIIRELEPVRRGPYCGIMFHAGTDGSFDSSVLIRTMTVAGNKVSVQAGCGIVADSDPEDELAEMRLKVSPLLAALV